MISHSYVLKTAVSLFFVFLSACATPQVLPSGVAKSFYEQEGIIETYYEQVTNINSNDMQSYLTDETPISKWPTWDVWSPEVKFLSDDELWYFSTDPKSWKNNAGRMGFCVFRNNEVITRYNTLMN